MKKRLILSFDYELFLGNRSGTLNKGLVEPTKKLLGLLKEAGFKGIFFVDTEIGRAHV